MQKTEEQHLHFCSTDSEQELKINWQCWVVNLSFMRIEKLLQGNLLQGLTHFVCLGRMQFQIKHKERGLRLNFDSLSFLSSFVLESLLLDAGNFAASQKIQWTLAVNCYHESLVNSREENVILCNSAVTNFFLSCVKIIITPSLNYNCCFNFTKTHNMLGLSLAYT